MRPIFDLNAPATVSNVGAQRFTMKCEPNVTATYPDACGSIKTLNLTDGNKQSE